MVHPYTVVVCSTDSYSDCWEPFFVLLDRYWPTRRAPVVLMTETRSFQRDGLAIECPVPFAGHADPASVPWATCLRAILAGHVHTDLVLILLDDFFLRAAVDEVGLDTCIAYMERHREVANVVLMPHGILDQCDPQVPWLATRRRSSPYLFTLQAGLWRRERLLHFIRNHESPWQFEVWGSLRGRRYPDRFATVVDSDARPDPIIPYVSPRGVGLIRGKWLPGSVAFFAAEGLAVDFGARGFHVQGAASSRPRPGTLTRIRDVARSLVW